MIVRCFVLISYYISADMMNIRNHMPKYEIVVIGASAGGLEPIKKLLSLLPSTLKLSIFIVIH